MSTEDDGSERSGTPWWVKATLTFGLAPAGLAYVTWWVLNVQATEIRDTKLAAQQAQAEHMQMKVDLGQSKADMGYIIMQMDRQDAILRLICWNSGRTPADRNACYSR